MAEIKKPMHLKHGDAEVRVTDPSKVNELSSALKDPSQFREFANDPKGVAAKYGLEIDDTVASQLKSRLADADTVDAVDTGGEVACTAVAVAMGAGAATDTKIALVI